jgi:hypothetical protein
MPDSRMDVAVGNGVGARLQEQRSDRLSGIFTTGYMFVTEPVR